jgi:hypothetical protein
MKRPVIEFRRVEDCLPGITGAHAKNYKSLKKIKWLDHCGPEGESHLLWVDVRGLTTWAQNRCRRFGPELVHALQLYTVEAASA